MASSLCSRYFKYFSTTAEHSFLREVEPRISQLQPGLFHVTDFLSPEQQVTLAKIALLRGEKGFWRMNETGGKVLNSAPYRGRIFDTVDSFPPIVAETHQYLMERFDELTNKEFHRKRATHLILLYYKTLAAAPSNGYIPWHQDNGENDGEEDYPVVSLSIGDTCNFLINNEKPKTDPSHPLSLPKNLAHCVELKSGDALIFCGPSRYIWHSIYTIHQNSAPSFLPFSGGRLNFTYRYTPKILGDEARFATKPANELSRDNQFFKLSKM